MKNKVIITWVLTLCLLGMGFSQNNTITIASGNYTPGSHTATAEHINSQENITGSQQVDYVFMKEAHLTSPFQIHALSGTGAFHAKGLAAANSELLFNGFSQSTSLGTTCINGARTIEFWFKPTNDINSGTINFPGYSLLVRNTAALQVDFGFYIKGTDWASDQGFLCFAAKDGSGATHEIKSNTNTWSSQTWYHVCGMIDPASGMKLFINGTVQSNTDGSLTTALTSTNNNVMLGVWGNSSSRFFNGKMDEVRVWNKVIATTTLQDNMCACVNVNNQSGLIAYWKFDEGTGTVGNDATPNNNIATVGSDWIPGNVATDAGSSCNRMNEFKIGFMGGFYYDQTNTAATVNGQNTSQLNIFKNDGVNIIQDYSPESNTHPGEMDRLKNNNMLFMSTFSNSYIANVPTYPGTSNLVPSANLEAYNFSGSYWDYPITGSNNFNPNCNSWLPPANLDDLFNVFTTTTYRDVIWGLETNEEAAFCHAHARGCPGAAATWPTDGGTGSTCGWYDDFFYSSETPVSIVQDIRSHWGSLINTNNMRTKLVSMEAGHGWTLSYEYPGGKKGTGKANIVGMNFVDMLNPNDPKDVFFEGSYSGFTPGAIDGNNTDGAFQAWDKNNLGGQNWNYFNRFEDMSIAKYKCHEVHAVNAIGGANDPTQFYFHSRGANNLANADYLWFEAYTSIIHGVSGVWFYMIQSAYDLRKGVVNNQVVDINPTDVQNKAALDNAQDPRNNISDLSLYDEAHFPSSYNEYIRYLTRELAYLKNNGFLNIDGSSELYSRTSGNDDNANIISQFSPLEFSDAVLPGDCGVSEYCCNIGNENDQFFNQTCPSTHNFNISSFWNRNKDYPMYKPRYTLRTNGNDVILILSNPFPFGMTATLDFGCVNNDIIRNSIGLDMLFANQEWDAGGGNNTNGDANPYKRNRDGLVDLVNNSVGIQQFLPYTSGQSRSVNMGPLDVMVFKFHKNPTPFTGTKNGFAKYWTNHGNNQIGGWGMNPSDYYYSGDFDGDGKKNELLCAQAVPGTWMTLLQFDGTTWNTLWSTNGAYTGIMDYRHCFIVGDFNGDGKDDLLGNDAGAGWTTLFTYQNNTWNWAWSDNGNSHVIRQYKGKLVRGDYDGDGKDELLGISLPQGSIGILKYNGSDFIQKWVRSYPGNPYGYGTTSLYGVRASTLQPGDFNGDAVTDLACSNNNEFLTFNFSSGDFNSNTGDFSLFVRPGCSDGTLNGWVHGPADMIMAGNLDYVDGSDELFLMSQGGWCQTNSLKTDYASANYCEEIWSSNVWASAQDPNSPYLDDYYIPGGNMSPGWLNNNYNAIFSCSQSLHEGVLLIRKTCLGLCNIYYANDAVTNYRTQAGENTEPLANSAPSNEEVALTFDLFPNPANNHFTCVINSGKEIKNAVLNVEDPSGRIIESFNISSPGKNYSKAFEVNLQNGTYIVSLITDSGTMHRRLIISR